MDSIARFGAGGLIKNPFAPAQEEIKVGLDSSGSSPRLRMEIHRNSDVLAAEVPLNGSPVALGGFQAQLGEDQGKAFLYLTDSQHNVTKVAIPSLNQVLSGGEIHAANQLANALRRLSRLAQPLELRDAQWEGVTDLNAKAVASMVAEVGGNPSQLRARGVYSFIGAFISHKGTHAPVSITPFGGKDSDQDTGVVIKFPGHKAVILRPGDQSALQTDNGPATLSFAEDGSIQIAHAEASHSGRIQLKEWANAPSVVTGPDSAGGIKPGSVAEWDAPKVVLTHTPSTELTWALFHPPGGLLERPFSLEGAQDEHRDYLNALREEGAQVMTIEQVLLAGTVDWSGRTVEGPALDKLRELAFDSITIDISAYPGAKMAQEQETVRNAMKEMDPEVLVHAVFNRPILKLKPTEINTEYYVEYGADPVTNLYFLRDQMITTAKGVVVAKMNSAQRASETKIIKAALDKLGIKPILEIEGTGRLEGGDFIPAGDTVFIGQGVRTNAEGIQQLLEADAFGADRVVVAKDHWHQQEQMHLDTFFNVHGPGKAVLVEDRLNKAGPEKTLTVDVFEKDPTTGKYEKVVADGDFVDYVRNELGYTFTSITAEEQEGYGANFLTVGDGRIMAVKDVGPEYEQRMIDAGIEARYINMDNLKGGWGAAHCTTQVLVREPI